MTAAERARRDAAVAAEANRTIDIIGSGMTTTVRRPVLAAMLEQTGGWFFWLGRKCTIKSKHLGVGVYSVSVERDPP